MGGGSQAIRQFVRTRKMILTARKHGHWLQISMCALEFMVNHVAFYTTPRLWQRDFRGLFAIYRGITQGLSPLLKIPNVKDTKAALQ
jgi:hypothetical protein